VQTHLKKRTRKTMQRSNLIFARVRAQRCAFNFSSKTIPLFCYRPQIHIFRLHARPHSTKRNGKRENSSRASFREAIAFLSFLPCKTLRYLEWSIRIDYLCISLEHM